LKFTVRTVRKSWAGSHRGEEKCMQGFLGKSEILVGYLVDVEVDGRTISRWILKKQGARSWTD